MIHNKSLLFMGFMILGGSISHVYLFGPPAFITGAIVFAIFAILIALYTRTLNTTFAWIYLGLSIPIIFGLGIVNGFWNHTVKVALFFLHSGYLPPMLENLFSDPKLGDLLYEGIGILTFLASIFAVTYTIIFARQIIAGRKRHAY